MKTERLKGRTALVTGASRGIGRAIAERLAAEGADLAINYASNAKAADEVAGVAASHGVKARIYQANIGVESDCVRLASEVMADFKQVDILIHNAGLGSAAIARPSVSDASNEQWESLLAVNLWGPIWLNRALVPHLRAASRSDVIMISSTAVQRLEPGSGVYAVGKAGLEAMAHTLAREERQHGMRVNIVAPGLVDTDMGRRVVAVTGGDIDAFGEHSPYGFVCTPADIAGTVAHLCSADGRYINNQRITIAGD